MIKNESGYTIGEWMKGKDIKDSHIQFEPIIIQEILKIRFLELKLAELQPEKVYIIKNILEDNKTIKEND